MTQKNTPHEARPDSRSRIETSDTHPDDSSRIENSNASSGSRIEKESKPIRRSLPKLGG